MCLSAGICYITILLRHIFFQKYSSSSPTIPDAKIRTESRTSSPIDSRTSSMTSLTPDEECLVSAGDEEEFVLIPSPMTRQRSKTVSFEKLLWFFESNFLRIPNDDPYLGGSFRKCTNVRK